MILITGETRELGKHEREEALTHGKVLGEGGEMGRKEADAADVRSETMQDSERDRHAIVGRGAASELVENDQRTRGGLCERVIRRRVSSERRLIAEEQNSAPW